MKVNRKINPAEAVKFKYNKECFDEIRKLLPNVEIEFNKARHPLAVGEILIFFFRGFSNLKREISGKEGDWVVLDSFGYFVIITDKEFQEQYETVV